MTKEETKRMTLEAVRRSISKWRGLLHEPGTQEKGCNDCALCMLYVHLLPAAGIGEPYKCNDCPIAVRTGMNCFGSPLISWQAHVAEHARTENLDIPYVYKGDCLVCERIINEEIRFLAGILDELEEEETK